MAPFLGVNGPQRPSWPASTLPNTPYKVVVLAVLDYLQRWGAQSFTDNLFHDWTLTARPDFSITYNRLLDAIALVSPCGAT